MKIMKRKILTVMLCCTMTFSLAACGGKQEEPVNTEVNEQRDEKEEENIKSAEEEPTPEPEAEEPEQVELKADTIDKYFGFEYADVADDAITGISFEIPYKMDGEDTSAVVNVPSVPCKYSEAEHPLISKEMRNSYLPGVSVDIYGVGITSNTISLDTGEAVLSQSVETPLDPAEIVNTITSMGVPYVDVSDYQHVYPIMMPRTVANAYNQPNNYSAFIITNASDEYINLDEAQITGFITSFSDSDSAYVNTVVADAINGNSTVQDAAKVVAPTSGTMLDNGAIVLTWVTDSGTTVEITFAADTYKALSLKVLSADMTPEILNSLGIR